MAGIFETATRSAIKEIILGTVHESKFGYVLSQDNLEALSSQLYDLFLTSRNLKAAGDRMLTQGLPSVPQTPKRAVRP